MNIVHAGGVIDNIPYTNSVEAVTKAISYGYTYIELDIIKIKDGHIIAHNGKENIYNHNGKFKNITMQEYDKLKIYNRYTPLNFERLSKILDNSRIQIIFDTKFKTSEALLNFINYTKKLKIDFNRLYFQIYNKSDLNILLETNIKNCLIVTWKYYDNEPYHNDIFTMISICKTNNMNLLGISLKFKHFTDPKIKKLLNTGYQLYFHDIYDSNLTDDEILAYNKKSHYFFIENTVDQKRFFA